MSYVLHYAPDNASLMIRLALEYRDIPYRTELVDRATQAQTRAAFRTLNPHGLIPVLETPQTTLFETGAILLWLADTHGGLGPTPDAPDRGDFLKWLFYLSNTIHPAERMLFYPDKFIAPAQAEMLRTGLRAHLLQCFARLEEVAASKPSWFGTGQPTVMDFYAAGLLRWPALYPAASNMRWFRLSAYPALNALCAHLETLPCTDALQRAEGLGDKPFTDPHPPSPPEGSAT